MAIDVATYQAIKEELEAKGVTLVAVSKTKPVADLQELYALGQRHFGENYVQELVEKQSQLPPDMQWHFIGHLQSNKVKLIAPFVQLIHGVDSYKLLKEIDKQGAKIGRVIPVLLQVHIAKEDTKFGFDEKELAELLQTTLPASAPLQYVHIKGLMGMASFVSNEEEIRQEFRSLKTLFDRYQTLNLPAVDFTTLSMGMSGDYKPAIEEGSNMVRIGSLIFGNRS